MSQTLLEGGKALDAGTDDRLTVDAPPIKHAPLRIIHCFRSPVGGIFRHVRDLIAEQVAAGHSVGVVCDDNTGGPFEESLLEALKPSLALGLHRTEMDRAIRLRDVAVLWRLRRTLEALDLDVLHSHGAKGGAYARLIGTTLRRGKSTPARLYCPHGGSMHFDSRGIAGAIYFRLERLLERATDHLVFVSNYERDAYLAKVGKPHCAFSVVANGLTEPEFVPVTPSPDAADFLYIGMMRDLKGVDVFLDALEHLHVEHGRPVSAVLVGDGPDLERYRKRAATLPDAITTIFLPPMPARAAFALGRTIVVPSRAESMPYIVLEALAAQRPLIATAVGGIPQIYGEHADTLVEAGNPKALAAAMANTQTRPDPALLAASLHERFSANTMASGVMRAYGAALAA
ncbi:glycosyltransferase family 4 protein [Rhizobiaceae bacterium]|nr:glycosyltransferase family 4 protein [Rhizobiaceae bacterium]